MLQAFLDVERRGHAKTHSRGATRPHSLGAAEGHSVRVVTYNIHTCVGVDRRYDPGRIAAVLHEIDADIACLQEVDARRGTGRYADQWAYLGEATGCRAIFGAGVHVENGRFGNAILTRFPVLAAQSIDLTVAGYEPRGAIDADLLLGDRVLRVIATHFGLRAGERRLQANRLMAALGGRLPRQRCEADAVLLMGDLNEWRGRSGAIRVFDRRLGPSAAERTFPSWLPVLALDRIYADGPAVLRDIGVYRSPLARLASDHLPLIGNLCWDGHAAWPRGQSYPPRRISRRAISRSKARARLS
ncbi:MAG: endonuclease/exonuclease/phosphatase family protein [Alphaproteobacteria bacterium]|nr:endonuclease/exonuclease/phosphatase family protein [Alphaproteobacteria bacterium]